MFDLLQGKAKCLPDFTFKSVTNVSRPLGLVMIMEGADGGTERGPPTISGGMVT